MSWIYLTSGLFLGWSLGANDAANLFGTAVGTKMLKFRTAALVGSVFVVIGAVAGAHGTSKTLGRLGAIDAPAGAFMVALAAALAVVLLLTKSGLPVSITQAIVGAIVGWNLFTGRPTDLKTLGQLVSSWLISPLLSALIAAALFALTRAALRRLKVHLLEVDAWTRGALVAAGAFGAFSLGQNDIANVMGVFVRVSPFPETTRFGPFGATSVEMLFLLGGRGDRRRYLHLFAPGHAPPRLRADVAVAARRAHRGPGGRHGPLRLRLARPAATREGLPSSGLAAPSRLGDAGGRRSDPRDLRREAERDPGKGAGADRPGVARGAGGGARDRARRPLRPPERLRAAGQRDSAARRSGRGGAGTPAS